jgi:hypothetical protein
VAEDGGERTEDVAEVEGGAAVVLNAGFVALFVPCVVAVILSGGWGVSVSALDLSFFSLLGGDGVRTCGWRIPEPLVPWRTPGGSSGSWLVPPDSTTIGGREVCCRRRLPQLPLLVLLCLLLLRLPADEVVVEEEAGPVQQRLQPSLLLSTTTVAIPAKVVEEVEGGQIQMSR